MTKLSDVIKGIKPPVSELAGQLFAPWSRSATSRLYLRPVLGCCHVVCLSLPF